MRSSFYCHPLFSFGDRFTNAHEQVLIGSACVSVGRAGCGWERTESWGLVQRLFWLVWQYESLKATQWPILLSSSLFRKNHKHQVRPRCWRSWSLGNVQILNCFVCCTLQICSCAFSVCLPLSYVFWLYFILFYFLKVQSLLYPSPACSLLECLAFMFIHYCICHVKFLLP